MNILLLIIATVLITLKLAGVIAASWWLVLMPLWLPFALAGVVMVLIFLGIVTVAIAQALVDR